MLIGGFQKQSLIDYPGVFSSVIFTSGCNMRCPFCHNPDLVLPERIRSSSKVPEEDILDYLESKRGLIDAVVITGGEPTMQPDLIGFIEEVKSMGFLIKLDTNGTNPSILKTLIDRKLIDYVAMDVKAPLCLEKYRMLAGDHLTEEHMSRISRSISIIQDSGIRNEFRTTVIREKHRKEDLYDIFKALEGSENYSLQAFNPSEIIDSSYSGFTSYDPEELKEIISGFKEKMPNIKLR